MHLKSRREEFSIESSMQQHEPRGLPLEPFTFRRVIRDTVISQVFDKAIHLALLVVNLVDFFGLLDA